MRNALSLRTWSSEEKLEMIFGKSPTHMDQFGVYKFLHFRDFGDAAFVLPISINPTLKSLKSERTDKSLIDYQNGFTDTSLWSSSKRAGTAPSTDTQGLPPAATPNIVMYSTFLGPTGATPPASNGAPFTH